MVYDDLKIMYHNGYDNGAAEFLSRMVDDSKIYDFVMRGTSL